MVMVKDKIVTVKDRCPTLSVMSYPFCPLPLPLSVMVTGQDSNGTGQNLINMSVLIQVFLL